MTVKFIILCHYAAFCLNTWQLNRSNNSYLWHSGVYLNTSTDIHPDTVTRRLVPVNTYIRKNKYDIIRLQFTFQIISFELSPSEHCYCYNISTLLYNSNVPLLHYITRFIIISIFNNIIYYFNSKATLFKNLPIYKKWVPGPWPGCGLAGLRGSRNLVRDHNAKPLERRLNTTNSPTGPALRRPAFQTKLCKLEDAPLILPLTLTSNTATYLAYRCSSACVGVFGGEAWSRMCECRDNDTSASVRGPPNP